MEANASYGAVRERGDIDVQSAIGATRVLMCSLRLARGCHGDGVSERKARGGHVSELTFNLREGTVSATQSSFTDCITAAFTAEDQSMRQSSANSRNSGAMRETTVSGRYWIPALSSTRLKRDKRRNSLRHLVEAACTTVLRATGDSCLVAK